MVDINLYSDRMRMGFIMMKRMVWKIVTTDTTPVETITAVQSMLFGMWMLLPFETFDSGGVFNTMAMIAPESAWGVVMAVVGAYQLYAVHSRKIGRRIWITRIMLPIWIIVDLSFFLSRIASSATITYFVFVLCGAWSLISLAFRQGHRGRN